MIETIKKEIDGLTFFIQQFPARQGQKLEKRVITILAPALDILSELKNLTDVNSEINIAKISSIFQKILSNLDDNTFDKFIADMTCNTSVELKNLDGDGVKPILLTNGNIFDTVFAGKSITLYKLLIEIMRVNRFVFFALVDGNAAIMNILSGLSTSKTQI